MDFKKEGCMLQRRYQYDAKPILNLNELQRSIKAQIESKIEQGKFEFETVSCCICGSENFQPLSEKDRYGLYMPVALCRQCGLIQTNPRMTQASYNEFYNEEYRQLYGAGLWEYSTPEGFFEGQYTNKAPRIFQYLKHAGVLSKPPAQTLIVEVGCATGGILNFFKGLGYQVKGVDLTASFVAYGKDKYSLDLTYGSLSDLKFDRSPDIVFYRHVFEHLLDPVEELRILRDALSQDSVVYIEVPGVKNLNVYFMELLRYLQNAHTYHFSMTTLRNLFESNGFQCVAGNEEIQSLFKLRTESSGPRVDNDSKDVLAYLAKAEKHRTSKLRKVLARLRCMFLNARA